MSVKIHLEKVASKLLILNTVKRLKPTCFNVAVQIHIFQIMIQFTYNYPNLTLYKHENNMKNGKQYMFLLCAGTTNLQNGNLCT